MRNERIFRLVCLLLENKMSFTLQYSKNQNVVFWVQNKYMPCVTCRIKQNKDTTFGFLSNFTQPKIISNGLTLEETFEMAKEHYNHVEGDEL